MTNGDPVEILDVEDKNSQCASIVLALQNVIPDVLVAVVWGGPAALDFLFRHGALAKSAGEDPPKLILIDLSLLGAYGFSVIAPIRSAEPQDALTVTPVVNLTHSQTSNDIKESYRCGANSYIIKPLSFPNVEAIGKSVGNY